MIEWTLKIKMYTQEQALVAKVTRGKGKKMKLKGSDRVKNCNQEEAW